MAPPTSYSSPPVLSTSHYVRSHRYPHLTAFAARSCCRLLEEIKVSKYPLNHRPSITPGITYTLHPVRGYVLFLFPRVRTIFCTPLLIVSYTCYIVFALPWRLA